MPLVGDWEGKKMLVSGRSKPERKDFRGFVGDLYSTILKRLEALTRIGSQGPARFLGALGHYGFVLDIGDFPVLRLRRFRREEEEAALFLGETAGLGVPREQGRPSFRIQRLFEHRRATSRKASIVGGPAGTAFGREGADTGQVPLVMGVPTERVEGGFAQDYRTLPHALASDEMVVVRRALGEGRFIRGTGTRPGLSGVEPGFVDAGKASLLQGSFALPITSSGSGMLVARGGYGGRGGGRRGSIRRQQFGRQGYQIGVSQARSAPGGRVSLLPEARETGRERFIGGIEPYVGSALSDLPFLTDLVSDFYPAVNTGLLASGAGVETLGKGDAQSLLARLTYEPTGAWGIPADLLRIEAPETSTFVILRKALQNLEPADYISGLRGISAPPARTSASLSGVLAPPIATARRGVLAPVPTRDYGLAHRAEESASRTSEERRVGIPLQEGWVVPAQDVSVPHAFVVRKFHGRFGGLSGFVPPHPVGRVPFGFGEEGSKVSPSDLVVISLIASASGFRRYLSSELASLPAVPTTGALGGSRLERAFRLRLAQPLSGGVSFAPKVSDAIAYIFARNLGASGVCLGLFEQMGRLEKEAGATFEPVPAFAEFEPVFVRLLRHSYIRGVAEQGERLGEMASLLGHVQGRERIAHGSLRGSKFHPYGRTLGARGERGIVFAGLGASRQALEFAGHRGESRSVLGGARREGSVYSRSGSADLGPYPNLALELDEIERVFLSLRKQFSVLGGELPKVGVVPAQRYAKAGESGVVREDRAVPWPSVYYPGEKYRAMGLSQALGLVAEREGFPSGASRVGVAPSFYAVPEGFEHVLVSLRGLSAVSDTPIATWVAGGDGVREHGRRGVLRAGPRGAIAQRQGLSSDYSTAYSVRSDAGRHLTGSRGTPVLRPFAPDANALVFSGGRAVFAGQARVAPSGITSERVTVTYPEDLLLFGGQSEAGLARSRTLGGGFDFSIINLLPRVFGSRWVGGEEDARRSFTAPGRGFLSPRGGARVPSFNLKPGEDTLLALLAFAPSSTGKGFAQVKEETSAEGFSRFLDTRREGGGATRMTSSEAKSPMVVIKPQPVEGKLPGIPEESEVFEWSMENVSFGGGGSPVNVASGSPGLFGQMAGSQVKILGTKGFEPALGGSMPLISQGGGSQASVALASRTQGAPKGGSPSEEKKPSEATTPVDLDVLAIEMAERIMDRIRREKERRGHYG